MVDYKVLAPFSYIKSIFWRDCLKSSINRKNDYNERNLFQSLSGNLTVFFKQNLKTVVKHEFNLKLTVVVTTLQIRLLLGWRQRLRVGREKLHNCRGFAIPVKTTTQVAVEID